MHRRDLLDPRAGSWFGRRTFRNLSADPAPLARLKRDRGYRVAVCLPALNEVETAGVVCGEIRARLMEETPLVDELHLIDTGSTDGTIDVARAAGASVHEVGDILPEVTLDGGGGKGEALWRSLAVTDCDIVVWCDSDIHNFDAGYVCKLVAPLLADDEIRLVKAYYHRPVEKLVLEPGSSGTDGVVSMGGGRVTELVVRPLLSLFYPELCGVIQPLAGEYAGRRSMLVELPFFTGYGVEVGILLDVVERFGLEGIAQVDLGVRRHRSQDVVALGKMAFQVASAMLGRLHDLGRVRIDTEMPEVLVQFAELNGGPAAKATSLGITERPPMASILSSSRRRDLTGTASPPRD